jgi:SAM-dependent methyltransferase
MGIGPTALRLYEALLTNGNFRRGLSVCELGSQDFVPKSFGKWANVTSDKGARGLYEYLGMTPYVCIDLNGEHDAMPLDLNSATWIGDQFDVVTNHGTTEHVFNQANVFRLMHDLTKLGGLMIHIVPSKGYPRHGLFVYGELLFEELEYANKYGLLTSYEENDRSGALIVVVLRKLVDMPFVVPMQRVYGSSVPKREA